MEIKLSIIIPVYNAEKYIGKCLDSLLGQTLKEFEMICVDDGSTDNSLAVLRKYAGTDSRIHVIHQENKGCNAARKMGYKHAKGKFIALVDADDWVENDIYEIVIEKMEERNADCAIFNWYMERKADSFRCPAVDDFFLMDKELIYKISLAGLCGGCNPLVKGRLEGWPWNKVFRKKIFDKLDVDGKLFSDETRHFEDALNNIRLFQHIDSILFMRQYGYHYRTGNHLSMTAKYFGTLPPKKDFLHYKAFGKENSLDIMYYSAIDTMIVNMFWNYITRHYYFHKKNSDSFRKQMKEINDLLKGKYRKNCYFPIKEALNGAVPDWIDNRIMRFLVRYHMMSAVSLYIASRISLMKKNIYAIHLHYKCC